MKNQKPTNKFYNKFQTQKTVSKKSSDYSKSKKIEKFDKFEKSKNHAENFSEKKSSQNKFSKENKFSKTEKINFKNSSNKFSKNKIHSELKSTLQSSLFNPQKIPLDAKSILENFDSIVQDNLPLNSKQLSKLPDDIRELSHQLTDERDTRKTSYMNEKTLLSAYARYFMWWNLVRLTRLFSNIDISKCDLQDGDICLDIGSGPLTVVIALYLSRPELRALNLTWYCLDISQAAMTLGENIFLSLVAKSEVHSNWKIVRVKGMLGTPIKEKSKLITCANMFNEAFQSESRPLDFLAKKYSDDLKKYSNEKSSFLIIEPGVPRSARFISLLRDNFIRHDFEIVSPCSHCENCPMDGRLLKGAHVNQNKNSENAKTGKWCNFAFPTKNAPEKLQKISSNAKLPKERAVLSFVFATPKSQNHEATDNSLLLRIASDPIKLENEKVGFYACSKLGLTLYIPKKGELTFSGDLILVEQNNEKEKKINFDEFKKDAKTNAIIIDNSK